MVSYTLCLNMIVKNESKIITRLFDSVISIIDSYCICDTGSTDNTIQIIESYFHERGIPGEVFQIPFKNFGYNRTESLKRSAQWGKYALLLDADMVLEISPNFKKSDIFLDVYQIKQANSSLDYYNTRIVRTDIGVTVVGVTHEYYSIPSGHKTGQLNTLVINDIGDGGAKADKFERDIRLLKIGIIEEPSNDRYHFYLANSYRDFGNIKGDNKMLMKAIKWYKRRVAMGGWLEELFISCLELGSLYMKLDQPESAIYWWLEGWRYKKGRAESLYEIVKYYREKGTEYAQLAAHFYNLAKDIPYPNGDVLFIRKRVYDYLLEYEWSILAYYLKWDVDSHRYLKLLGGHPNYDSIISNYKFYAPILKNWGGARHEFKATIELNGETFRPSTPSIIPYGDGYLMNQRYVNYFIEPNGGYTQHNGTVKTINRRIRLNRDFEVLEQSDLDDLGSYGTCNIIGVEDLKLFGTDDKVIFLGTEKDPATSNICMVAGEYPVDGDVKKLERQSLQSPYARRCEKNWVYFEGGVGLGTVENKTNEDGDKIEGSPDNVKIVYEWSPLTVGHLDGDKFVVDSLDRDVPNFFKHVRGSSNGYSRSVDGETWFVTHMVDYSSPRRYYHLVVVLDTATAKYKRHSVLFRFENETPIEYSLGLIVEDDRIIFGYSKMDRSTTLAVYERPAIDERLFAGQGGQLSP